MTFTSRGARKYVEIFNGTVRSRLAYLPDVLASSLFLILVLFVFVQLWRATLGGSDKMIEGFDLARMIWYYVTTETFIMSTTPLHRTIEREIREGDVAIRLNKPYSYLLFHFGAFMAEAVVKSVVLIVIGTAVTLAMVGPIPFSAASIPALVLTYVVTMALNFCYSAFIGLIAFWTEDITGVFFILDRVKWLLGGFLLPISLFPEPVRSMAEMMPFQWMIYAPARLAVDFSWERWIDVFSRQIGLLVLFAGFISWVYARGVRRLNVNGG